MFAKIIKDDDDPQFKWGQSQVEEWDGSAEVWRLLDERMDVARSNFGSAAVTVTCQTLNINVKCKASKFEVQILISNVYVFDC